jgi:hypothetical protein
MWEEMSVAVGEEKLAKKSWRRLSQDDHLEIERQLRRASSQLLNTFGSPTARSQSPSKYQRRFTSSTPPEVFKSMP